MSQFFIRMFLLFSDYNIINFSCWYVIILGINYCTNDINIKYNIKKLDWKFYDIKTLEKNRSVYDI